MAEVPESSATASAILPSAVVAPKSRGMLTLVWLVPLVALLIGGWLAAKTIMERGPTITITFRNAEGIEAGKTRLKYKHVEIGQIKRVDLSSDLKKVIVTAELNKDFAPYLVEDTAFWVARAGISGGNVYGLGTLISGSFIGVDVGKSSTPRREFVGLEAVPVTRVDTPGREYVLHANDLGSIDIGSPLFFRRLQVGQVKSYALDKDGRGVSISVFVNAPYDQYVTDKTRFWNASGVDLTLGASGIKLDTQSLSSILVGGIAFEAPEESADAPTAEANRRFNLFANRTLAMRNPETEILQFTLKFKESVRGLAPGAPLDFRGIEVGEVISLHVETDPESKQVIVLANANLYPARLRTYLRDSRKTKSGKNGDNHQRNTLDNLVSKGLRAKLQTGSLLTGQMYIALDFVPDAPKARIDWGQTPPELPTQPSNMQALQLTLDNILKKLDRMPLEEIGSNLDKTLRNADALLRRLDTETAPEAKKVFAEVRETLKTAERVLSTESPLQQDAREAMRELGRAAQAFRSLADYLERHPEALLQGKKEDKQ